MSAYIHKLKKYDEEHNDHDVYPVTKAAAVFMENGTDCETEINSKLTAEKIIDTLQDCIDEAEEGAPAGSIAVNEIYQSFLDGCRRIAQAIVDNGVTTASATDTNLDSIVSNINKIRKPIIPNKVYKADTAEEAQTTEDIEVGYHPAPGSKIDYLPAYRFGQQSVMGKLTQGEFFLKGKCPADETTPNLWKDYNMTLDNDGGYWYMSECKICGRKEEHTNGHHHPAHNRAVKYTGYYAQGSIDL